MRKRGARRLGLAWALFLASAAVPAMAGSDIGLSGNWSRADGSARISIAPCGESLCATNTFVKDPSKGERVGDRFVLSVRPRQPATLAGETFDVRRGVTYTLLISLEQDAMTTRGCLAAGIVCRTMNWIRVP